MKDAAIRTDEAINDQDLAALQKQKLKLDERLKKLHAKKHRKKLVKRRKLKQSAAKKSSARVLLKYSRTVLGF